MSQNYFKTSLVAYQSQDPLDPIPLSDLSTDRIRSEGGDYDVVLLPQGAVLYRGIDGQDCFQKAVVSQNTPDNYGKWYGSIIVASYYAKQNDRDRNNREKSAVCAVQLKNVCRLLNMSDPDTRTLIVQRLALRDQQRLKQGQPPIVYKKQQTSLQQLFSKAFGYKNTHPQRLQTQPKQRRSFYSIDQLLVKELRKLFPRVDGYIYINTWGQASKNFHNELNLFQPQQCVELLDEKTKKHLFLSCLESFLLVDPKTRQTYLLNRRKEAKVLLERYFPVVFSLWKQQFLKFLSQTSQSQLDTLDYNMRQLDDIYMQTLYAS